MDSLSTIAAVAAAPAATVSRFNIPKGRVSERAHCIVFPLQTNVRPSNVVFVSRLLLSEVGTAAALILHGTYLDGTCYRGLMYVPQKELRVSYRSNALLVSLSVRDTSFRRNHRPLIIQTVQRGGSGRRTNEQERVQFHDPGLSARLSNRRPRVLEMEAPSSGFEKAEHAV